MNRYTYKAKRKDNGEWVYGTLEYNFLENRINETKEYFIKSYFKNEMFGKMKYQTCNYEIIPETLCQCTGLQDRDGKDIFENDTLPMGTSIIAGKEEIIYDTVKYVNGIYEPIAYWKKEVLKVIGNKFDKEED